MADWPFSPEEMKAAAGGGFGSLVLIYLRHPGTLLRAVARVGIGAGCASVFTFTASDVLGWPVMPLSVVIGLTATALAEKVLKAADNADFSALTKRRE